MTHQELLLGLHLNSLHHHHLQQAHPVLQMEECHKMLTDQVDWTNPEGDQVTVDVNRPLPLGGPSDMILCRVKKKFDHTCGFSVLSKLNHTQDTGMTTYQKQLNLTKPGWDARGYEFKHDYTIIESTRAVVFSVNNNERKIMRSYEIYKFSDGRLAWILEALAYKVKEFKIKQLNPGMNMRFWTRKDMTRSKEFIAAIERRLKTRRIYRTWNALLVDEFVILTTDFEELVILHTQERFGE
uniref:Uncharacterized protein n=1 Tax=Tanacetum cinerariifolium TaxID=118510 RepID=A0A6L2N0F5_TANCI|nr:hypothetical protein [Tanacetum cinerariifolium]